MPKDVTTSSGLSDSEKILEIISLHFIHQKMNEIAEACNNDLRMKSKTPRLDRVQEVLSLNTSDTQADQGYLEIIAKTLHEKISDLCKAENIQLFNPTKWAEGLTEKWVRLRHEGGVAKIGIAYTLFAGSAASAIMLAKKNPLVGAAFLMGAIATGLHKWAVKLLKDHKKRNAIGEIHRSAAAVRKRLKECIKEYGSSDTLKVTARAGGVTIQRLKGSKLHSDAGPALISLPKEGKAKSGWFNDGKAVNKAAVLELGAYVESSGVGVQDWDSRIDMIDQEAVQRALEYWANNEIVQKEGDWLQRALDESELGHFTNGVRPTLPGQWQSTPKP